MYQFFLDGTSLGTQSSVDSVIIDNVQNGQYVSVLATDLGNNCTAYSPDVFFQVMDIPQINAVPDVEFCQYDSVILVSDAQLNNQWLYNQNVVFGENSSEFVVFEGGIYNVLAGAGSFGGVFSCGENGLGQLGDGTDNPSLTIAQAEITDTVSMISAGQNFVMAIDNNNKLWAWGENTWGNLGVGNYAPAYSPVSVASLTDIIDVATGNNHTIALKSDGTLMSWGKNLSGQLGFGNYVSSNFPIAIPLVQNIVAVAAGKSYSLALTDDGHVYSWGENTYGQLGNGNFTNNPTPTLISGLENVVFIAAGANHSFAITSDGSLWVWGSNENGQLGLNNNNSSNIPLRNPYLRNIVDVDGGNSHSVAINQRGEAFAWGNNTYGQLGTQNQVSSLIPKKIDIVGVSEISCGFYNSFAIRQDASLWAWGQNNYGQLGDQTTQNKLSPTRASQFFGAEKVVAGEYFVTTVWKNEHSCISEDVEITMNPVHDVTIEQNDNTLSTISGVSYQWFLNGNQIPNANGQTLLTTFAGDYMVEVYFESGCSNISEVYTLVVNMNELFSENNVIISPNPNDGSFKLELNMSDEILKEITAYKLVSVSGVVITTNSEFDAHASQNLSFEGIASGMYYLVLTLTLGEMNIKVIVN